MTIQTAQKLELQNIDLDTERDDIAGACNAPAIRSNYEIIGRVEEIPDSYSVNTSGVSSNSTSTNQVTYAAPAPESVGDMKPNYITNDMIDDAYAAYYQTDAEMDAAVDELNQGIINGTYITTDANGFDSADYGKIIALQERITAGAISCARSPRS